MPRVHHVKKALKDNPVAKKGESYYWWKPMVNGRGGAKRYSKTPPKPSQLTSSEFLGTVYDIQDEIATAAASTMAELIDLRDGWVGEINDLKSETEDKLNNMPDGLQQGGHRATAARADRRPGFVGVRPRRNRYRRRPSPRT